MIIRNNITHVRCGYNYGHFFDIDS